jgi:hypothetical protein
MSTITTWNPGLERLDKIRKVAKEHGWTLSEITRQAVDKFLAEIDAGRNISTKKESESHE